MVSVVGGRLYCRRHFNHFTLRASRFYSNFTFGPPLKYLKGGHVLVTINGGARAESSAARCALPPSREAGIGVEAAHVLVCVVVFVFAC